MTFSQSLVVFLPRVGIKAGGTAGMRADNLRVYRKRARSPGWDLALFLLAGMICDGLIYRTRRVIIEDQGL